MVRPLNPGQVNFQHEHEVQIIHGAIEDTAPPKPDGKFIFVIWGCWCGFFAQSSTILAKQTRSEAPPAE